MKEPEVSGSISKKICEMVDSSGSSWSLESKTLVRLQITWVVWSVYLYPGGAEIDEESEEVDD